MWTHESRWPPSEIEGLGWLPPQVGGLYKVDVVQSDGSTDV